MTRLVHGYNAFEDCINKIYCAPLPDHDLANIFIAYNECSQQPAKKTTKRARTRKKGAGTTAELEDAAMWPHYHHHGTPEEHEPYHLSPEWDSPLIEDSWNDGMPSSPVYIDKPFWA